MKLAVHSKGRLSPEYQAGVFAFVESAKRDVEGKMRCPCKKCCNAYRFDGKLVGGHLIAHGILESYTTWYYHGETPASSLIPEVVGNVEMVNEDRDESRGIDALLEDNIRAENIGYNGGGEPTHTSQNDSSEKFDKLVIDAQREVYPGCTEFNLLQFVISVMNMKVVNKWSNKSLNMLLEFMKKLLPSENIVPNSTYEVKKILRDLGMGYESIHACKNDCSLFWKETASLDACLVCKESRYKYTGKGKKIPHKTLRWLPLIPRLQKLFMSRKIAEQMKWHSDRKTKNDGVLRHPCDGHEWQDFDRQHPEFAIEPRNVRLGLATDGFNPFGHMIGRAHV